MRNWTDQERSAYLAAKAEYDRAWMVDLKAAVKVSRKAERDLLDSPSSTNFARVYQVAKLALVNVEDDVRAKLQLRDYVKQKNDEAASAP